jgi:hypothetical protein
MGQAVTVTTQIPGENSGSHPSIERMLNKTKPKNNSKQNYPTSGLSYDLQLF